MTTIRRAVTVIGPMLAVVVGSSIPASATFTDRVEITTTVGTLTVAAPTELTLDDFCITTTTTVTETVYTHPGHGTTTTTSYDSTTTSPSSSNVQGTTSTTEPGPGPHEETTTTVTQNTDLHVTLSWAGSTTRGANGYLVSAHLGRDGSVSPQLRTDGATTSVTRVQDADALYHEPSLLVSTLTDYGWTADSTRTRVLSC